MTFFFAETVLASAREQLVSKNGNLSLSLRKNWVFRVPGRSPSDLFGHPGRRLWPPKPVPRSPGVALGVRGVRGVVFRAPLGSFWGENRSEKWKKRKILGLIRIVLNGYQQNVFLC